MNYTEAPGKHRTHHESSEGAGDDLQLANVAIQAQGPGLGREETEVHSDALRSGEGGSQSSNVKRGGEDYGAGEDV